MIETLAAHKAAALIIAAIAAVGIIYWRHTQAANAQTAAGFPVSPYGAGQPAVDSGSFSPSPSDLGITASGGLGGASAASGSGDGGGATATAADVTTPPPPQDSTAATNETLGTGPFGVPGVGAGTPNEFNIGIAGPSDYTVFGTPYGTSTPLAQGTPTGTDPYGTQALDQMIQSTYGGGISTDTAQPAGSQGGTGTGSAPQVASPGSATRAIIAGTAVAM